MNIFRKLAIVTLILISVDCAAQSAVRNARKRREKEANLLGGGGGTYHYKEPTYPQVDHMGICKHGLCQCGSETCGSDVGCYKNGGSQCIYSKAEYGHECFSSSGCMCGGTSSSFQLLCPIYSWCQVFNGKPICDVYILNTGEKCREEKCGCSKKGSYSDYLDKSCKRGMLCHHVDNDPSCTDVIIGVGVPCAEEKCICEIKGQNGGLLQSNLKRGQRCELIKDRIQVVESVIGVSATCQTKRCACIEKDPKLADTCHQDQVCSKLAGEDQLTCVTQIIKDGETCNNKHNDPCICQASSGTAAAGAKPWIKVDDDNTCLLFQNQLIQIAKTIKPNSICQFSRAPCLCNSDKNPADQILCGNYNVCAEFSTGLKCVPDINTLYFKAPQEMVCKSSNYQDITICQKDEICVQVRGKSTCLKSEIHSGDKCSDPLNCFCTFGSEGVNQGNPSTPTFSYNSQICKHEETCFTQESEDVAFCLAATAEVLKNGQFKLSDNFYCSNEGFAEGQPKQVPCRSNHFCIVQNKEPTCVAKKYQIPDLSFCSKNRVCICIGNKLFEGRAVMCSEGQQCLSGGSEGKCVKPMATHDTECTEPEGCYCHQNSELRLNIPIQSIHCKQGEYCSYDFDGPVCLTPKYKDDKAAQQEAKEMKGVACALRRGANTPVTVIRCPQHFTCAWADEDVAVCEASTTKIAMTPGQVCTNIRVGCVCQVDKSTENCQAGLFCKNDNGNPVCDGKTFKHFQVPKGCTSNCGTFAKRHKDQIQYCKIEGISSYDTQTPKESWLSFEDLLKEAKKYSFRRQYHKYDPKAGNRQSNRGLSTHVKI